MEKEYQMPAIVWLRTTDYMHSWLEWELGCEWRVKDQRVVCVQHLPGARDILRQESDDDMKLEPRKDPGNSLSGSRMNMYTAGLKLDPELMVREYGVTKDVLKQFVPVECPKMTMTRHGVLRPWTNDVNFSNSQASAMQRLLRQAFWHDVSEFSERYAKKRESEKYAQVEMIESFCQETKTPELYVDVLRREWQRRVKRERDNSLAQNIAKDS